MTESEAESLQNGGFSFPEFDETARQSSDARQELKLDHSSPVATRSAICATEFSQQTLYTVKTVLPEVNSFRPAPYPPLYAAEQSINPSPDVLSKASVTAR